MESASLAKVPSWPLVGIIVGILATPTLTLLPAFGVFFGAIGIACLFVFNAYLPR